MFVIKQFTTHETVIYGQYKDLHGATNAKIN